MSPPPPRLRAGRQISDAPLAACLAEIGPEWREVARCDWRVSSAGLRTLWRWHGALGGLEANSWRRALLQGEIVTVQGLGEGRQPVLYARRTTSG